VEAALVARGAAAASSLAVDLDLRVEDVVVLQNSNTLALRLLPCDVVARTAVAGQEVAAFEVSVARNLGACSAPIASLDPRVEPRVYERDDFAVTFWSYYDSVTGMASPSEYADALHRLHAAMRSIEVDAPHFTERIAAAEGLVADRHETPGLVDADRTLLLDALRDGRKALCSRVTADQLLHGEPHPGNLLVTRDGLLFIDLETCCLGPIEFDVAHAPVEVSALYPGVDQILLQESRRLVLAMVAAWRWDVRDEFPDGHRHGLKILELLRNGPPWPALGALSTD
jgi:aminoglycoside phosphotransferase (APT) family kinase protein|tara:strand:- start:3235 stop:4089 length:855 start_codon:yes stop_codon:yes gene_type:complete